MCESSAIGFFSYKDLYPIKTFQISIIVVPIKIIFLLEYN